MLGTICGQTHPGLEMSFQVFHYEFRCVGAYGIMQVICFIAGEAWRSAVTEKVGRPLHGVDCVH